MSARRLYLAAVVARFRGQIFLRRVWPREFRTSVETALATTVFACQFVFTYVFARISGIFARGDQKFLPVNPSEKFLRRGGLEARNPSGGGSYVRGTKVRVEFQCVGPSVWLRSESTRPFGED